MVKESENNSASNSEQIGADFFRRSDIAYLQGLGLDINPKKTTKIAKTVRDKFPITFEESRNARFSLRERIKGLGIGGYHSTLMLAFNRACDLGLIKPLVVSEPREALDKNELKVLAYSALALQRSAIAQKLGISDEEVDVCKASILVKFGTETLFPVVAKVRRDMKLQLQRTGNV